VLRALSEGQVQGRLASILGGDGPYGWSVGIARSVESGRVGNSVDPTTRASRRDSGETDRRERWEAREC
jgi:hypothetical protein